MQQFTYPVILTPDKEAGGFVVTCRDVAEVVTQGETIEGAIGEAQGALEAAIEMRIEDGMAIPVPSARKRGVCLIQSTAPKFPPWNAPCMPWASGWNWWWSESGFPWRSKFWRSQAWN